MNEGMFLALRNYLEELTAQNRQIISLLEQIAGAKIQPATVPDALTEAVTQKTTKTPAKKGK